MTKMLCYCRHSSQKRRKISVRPWIVFSSIKSPQVSVCLFVQRFESVYLYARKVFYTSDCSQVSLSHGWRDQTVGLNLTPELRSSR